ncbi:Delta(24)-sterol reductase [Lachnellula subtilissima]|uniref:Delta(24)-sterol reductase n=1 Tax=Lachnellula subtilissima TaxID=602034 RepID=A0A8H8RSJ7_9HELO|nr:Delta(24)-sterol reductase [Lachnellula subtilissima]
MKFHQTAIAVRRQRYPRLVHTQRRSASTKLQSPIPSPTRALIRNGSTRPSTTSTPSRLFIASLKGSIAPKTRSFSATLRTRDSTDLHKKAVEAISSTVRQYFAKGEKFRIYHGSTNSTRQSTLKRNLVDTSSLSNVLKVDVEAKTCLVEPNVPMDRLVEATLKHGLVPPVVMEFPGITVGGGYSGTSGESSSFKHGFFDRTINNVEMVLANGEVVTISPTEKPDLFHGAAGAVGTFGVTTLVELRLQKAAKYVETTYHPVYSMSDAIQKLHEFTANPELDYVDGIMFSKTNGAIVTGRLTDEKKEGLSVQRFGAARDPWFYMHVQDTIKKNGTGPTTEAVPLAEYLFRYDRGGFWVGKSAFEYLRFPFNRFTRWFLDDFLHTRMLYSALHASGESKKYVVQDLALPYSTAEQFVEYTDETFGIYPLWLCPLKQSPYPTMHPHYNKTEADGKTLQPMLNIGLWGFGPSNHDEFVRKNRDLERKLKELGGMKWLYAHTYYTEEEFWEQFDRPWYEKLRVKHNATSLPSVYEKVKVDVEAEKKAEKENGWFFHTKWPFNGFYGIKKAIESRTYLAARKSVWKSFGKEAN